MCLCRKKDQSYGHTISNTEIFGNKLGRKRRMTEKNYGNMVDRKKNFKCKECDMEFDDPVRLERHFKAAHPAKHDGFRPKWYWET